MKSVNIAELKNRLSHYLRIVRRGEPILIRDRDRTIARIEPVREPALAAGDEAERIANLVARGTLRPPEMRPTPAFWRDFLARMPKVKADVVGALLREREEGR